jgi:ribosome maturation factor RimP
LTDSAAPAPISSPLDELRLGDEHGVAARVARIAVPVLAQLGFRLVRVRLLQQGGQTLQIMIERPDGGCAIEDCEAASQALSPELDVADIITTEYRLELSSPGVDRPLVRASDFRRALGQEAKIELAQPTPSGRKRFRGKIRGVEGEGRAAVLVLERSDARPEEETLVRIELRDLDEARLVLTEDLIRASLRAAKHGAPAGDDDEARAAEGGDEPPARGSGRFAGACQSDKREPKKKPLVPAGVQTHFKKGGGAGPKG